MVGWRVWVVVHVSVIVVVVTAALMVSSAWVMEV